MKPVVVPQKMNHQANQSRHAVKKKWSYEEPDSQKRQQLPRMVGNVTTQEFF